MQILLTLTHNKRKRLWFVFKALYYLMFAIALIVVGGYLWKDRVVLVPVWHVPIFLWFIPAILYLATLIAKGLSFDVLAGVYNVRIPLPDSVGLTASGLLSNYAVPGNVSIPLRSLYMHRVLGLHYKDFLPIVLAAFVFSTGLYGVFAGIAAIVFGKIPSPAYAIAIALLSGGGLALIVALSLPYHVLPLVGPWIERLLSGWHRLCGSTRPFAQWLCVVILLATFEVSLFYSIIHILGIDLTVAQTAIIVFAKENSVFLRITPGAFGVAEGVQVFFATQFGIDAVPILLAAVIARSIELLTLSSISLVFAGRLTTRLAAGSRDREPGANA